MAHAGHGYTETIIDHHDDGSHTIEHRHEDGVSHKKHAKMDLDGLHDSLEEHLRHPKNEEELEEKIHPGIHEEVADKVKAGE